MTEQIWTCLLFFWDFWNYWVQAVTPSQVTTPLNSSLSSLFPLDFTLHSRPLLPCWPRSVCKTTPGCHSFTIIRIIFSPLSQVNCTNWLYEACINKILKSNKYASIPWALKKYQHVSKIIFSRRWHGSQNIRIFRPPMIFWSEGWSDGRFSQSISSSLNYCWQ